MGTISDGYRMSYDIILCLFFSLFLSAYDLARRRTLDNDVTPTLDANCPFEGKGPLLIGGECFLLHDGAGVLFTLIFWVV